MQNNMETTLHVNEPEFQKPEKLRNNKNWLEDWLHKIWGKYVAAELPSVLLLLRLD